MNKKITIMILVAMLFTSFGNVKATTSASLPDLVIDDLQIVSDDNQLFVELIFSNKGAAIPEGEKITLYVGEYDKFGNYSYNGNRTYKGGISTGSVEILMPPIDKSDTNSYNLRGRIDFTSYINESNELNNDFVKLVEIKNEESVSEDMTVSEQIKCVFNGTDIEQKCYIFVDDNEYSCSGIGSCIADVKGIKGVEVSYKSSCSGRANTTMDINNDSVVFKCGENITTVSEHVKCVFNGSKVEQTCYFAGENDKYTCSGVESCIVDVEGIKGDKMTWKSTCGGYGYTVMDGDSEYAKFSCDNQSVSINEKSELLFNNKNAEILTELKQLRNLVKEQNTKIKYLEKLTDKMQKLSAKMESALNNFITYGVDTNTQKLGEGERAAVISSYKSAYEKLPTTEAELADAIKIASGRWPSATSTKAEKKAKEQFAKIYKRIADMNNANDNAAITIMAYGLRQKAEARNLNSETTGIKTFRNIYGKNPNTTDDWNAMQAITYSGASRQKDTDGDFLPDDREIKLGTNPSNKDSDGDGYVDGTEVDNGYNPLKK